MEWPRLVAWWRSQVGGPRERPNEETLPFALDVLEAQLGRANEAIERLDQKAALVVPAVGVIATLVAPHLAPDIDSCGWRLAAGIGAGSAGALSMVFAITSLAPRSVSNGPAALDVVRGTSEDFLKAQQAVANSLGLSVYTAEELVLWKARLLSWSFRAGGVGVGLLVLFAALGGLT